MSGADRRREILRVAGEAGGGVVSWREFMRLALYDPEAGYYAGGVRDIGARGDFTTVPVRSGLLAAALWQWRERSGLDARLPWIEVGGGGGHLARGLAPSLLHPGDWMKGALHLVEISGTLRREQRRRLRGRRVCWWEDAADAWSSCGGEGILVGNELVDAFPCSVFELREEGWREVGVRFEGDGVFPAWIETPLPDSEIWRNPDFKVGQRVETHESFRDWWARWSGSVRSGRVVWIDYGAGGRELYHRRPGGTLRGYWKQQRVVWPEVLARFGRQDLTADVNFDDLIRWGEALGWKCLRYSSLAEFLRENMPPGYRISDEEKRLLNEAEAGGAFRVVVLEKSGENGK